MHLSRLADLPDVPRDVGSLSQDDVLHEHSVSIRIPGHRNEHVLHPRVGHMIQQLGQVVAVGT
jgi:hypothetical protein